jgi:hypothetical protein
MINVPLGSAPTGHMHTTDARIKNSPTDDKSVNEQQKWDRKRYHILTFLHPDYFLF